MNRGGHIALPSIVALAALALAALSPAVRAAEGAPDVAPLVRQALARALGAPGARIDSAIQDAGSSRASSCRATEAELPQPIQASGRVAVKISGRSPRGQRCEEWIWTRVRVVAPVAVTTRALKAGEALDGAVATEERELRAGHPAAALGPASLAGRALSAGQMLEAAFVAEPTLRPGETVKVLVVSGALTIEQSGRAVPCVRGRSCATLPSGKQVEGDLVDGRLVVQSE
jgi:flagella basal body P-ring formation protein FlgA